MISILGEKSKLTINELAKYLVADKGEIAHYWSDDDVDVNKLTEKEIVALNAAITKHIERVRVFLGMNKIFNKM